MPNNVPIPFRDYIGTIRLDWSQSARSQWFLRAAADNYTTRQRPRAAGHAAFDRRDFTLELSESASATNSTPSAPTWLGTRSPSMPAACITPKRAIPISALRSPFRSVPRRRPSRASRPSATTVHVTAITAFSGAAQSGKISVSLRRAAHAPGAHARASASNFIHEPVLEWSAPGTAGNTRSSFPTIPPIYVANPSQFYSDLTGVRPRLQRMEQPAPTTPAR